jgi:hypothetical protein
MLGFLGNSRARSKTGDIEHRLRSIEQRLEPSRMSAGATDTADHVGETLASALGTLARRFLGGTNSTSILGGPHSIRDEAGKIAGGATQLGNAAVRLIAGEIKHRPLAALALAIGIGVFVGVVGHRR